MLNIIRHGLVEIQCDQCSQLFIAVKSDAIRSRLGGICPECKAPIKGELTQKDLQRLLIYDPLTGVLSARIDRHGRAAGDILGYVSKSHGYLETSIDGKSYLVHRLIWLYQTGYMPEEVDHINHVKTDNSWVNLREASSLVNSKNTSLSTNSVTRVNGVSFMKSRNKYRAYIMVDRKQIHLGLFEDIKDAIAAREQADIDYGFHSNHGN